LLSAASVCLLALLITSIAATVAATEIRIQHAKDETVLPAMPKKVLVLVGIIFSLLFRSLAQFIQRLLAPNEFMVLTDTLFASFNSIDTRLLLLADAAVALASIAPATLFHCFDVLALGRTFAINQGIDHRRVVTKTLLLVSVLVAVSTALVGSVLLAIIF